MQSIMQKHYPTLLPFTGKIYSYNGCDETGFILFTDTCLEVYIVVLSLEINSDTVTPISRIIQKDVLVGEAFDLFCSALEQSYVVANRPDEDFYLNLEEAYICYKD